MSESQANPNPKNQNPPAAGNGSAGQTAPAAAAQTSTTQSTSTTTPTHKQANSSATKSSVQFQSSQIGTKTAKQHDPFAEQNAKRAQKNAKDSKRLKMVVYILISVLAVLIIALVIWLIVRPGKEPEAPEPTESTVHFTSGDVSENVAALQQLANNALNRKPEETSTGETIISSGDLSAANEVFETVLSTPGNEHFASQINLTRISFYVMNSEYEAAIAAKDLVNVDDLSGEDKFLYYNMLNLAYTSIGDENTANEYMRLQTDALIEFNGGGQG